MNDYLNDPYLWLEDVESPKALEFVSQANESTLAWIEKTESYQRYYTKMLDFLHSDEKELQGFLHKSYLYNFWRDSKYPKGIWRRAPLAALTEWEILLDLNDIEGQWVYQHVSFHPLDDQYVLLSLSDAGKDASIIREYDLKNKKFVEGGFALPLEKQTAIYANADHILVARGKKNSAGYAQQVWKLKRGQNLQQMELFFECTGDHWLWVQEVLDLDSQELIPIIGETPEFWKSIIHFYWQQKIIKTAMPNETSLLGVKSKIAYFFVTEDTSTFKKGTILSVDLRTPEQIKIEWIPPQDIFVSDIVLTKSGFLVSHLKNAHYKLHFLQGNNFTEVSASVSNDAYKSLSVFAHDSFSDQILLMQESFLEPKKILQFNMSTYALKEIWSGKPGFDSTHLKVEQHWVKSKDGTLIPYFVIAPKIINRPTPTVLYGYGGFRYSETPYYLNEIGKTWLADGGIWVIANIRGGDEFGDTWHSSVTKLNRKKCFEDFSAVADDLIQKKLCERKQLAIHGGSNGGLLVGATMTQRPDLCAAVMCEVPLLDMARFHLLLAGSLWTSEYGSVEESDALKEYILSYSPYHNIKANERYPQCLFKTSTFDDRVHPGHARKMYAKMKAAGHSAWYYEEYHGGHGGNTPPQIRAKNLAIRYSFLFETTSMSDPGTPTLSSI